MTAFASLNRQPVDLGLTEIVLKDLILTGEDLCGASRGRAPVTARA